MVAFEENRGKIGGIKLGQGVLAVTHLLYTDDILVSCWAMVDGAKIVMEIFETFGRWLRLRVNKGKSKIFFSQKIDWRLKGQIKQQVSKICKEAQCTLEIPFYWEQIKLKNLREFKKGFNIVLKVGKANIFPKLVK